MTSGPLPAGAPLGGPLTAARRAVSLNADVGEGFGRWEAGDAALLDHVTTAHVACGFHAGDPAVMRRTVAAVAERSLELGAHPSYPDLVGFGRRAMAVPAAQVADDVLYQVGALEAIARTEGTLVRTVKPHGALYHRMCVDQECARAVATALARYGGDLVLVLAAGAPTLGAVAAEGVRVATEGFCDRLYGPDGTLVGREVDGAVIDDPARVADQALSLALDGLVRARDGSEVLLAVDTLCVHGDTPSAPAAARAVRTALARAGVVVAPLSSTPVPAVPPGPC